MEEEIAPEILADMAAFGAGFSKDEWEQIGPPKTCAREGCGGVFYRETTVTHTWEVPWGRRIYRNGWRVKYCSEACRKALERQKGPPKYPSTSILRVRNKAKDEKYGRCRIWRLCGNWIVGRRADAKFCSPECQQRYWKFKRRRDRKGEAA